MKLFSLKITLPDFPTVYRTIQMSGTLTYEDLHAAIFEAFGRDEGDYYSFFITRDTVEPLEQAAKAREITSPYTLDFDSEDEDDNRLDASAVELDGLRLKKGNIFYYRLKHNGQWWHQIEILDIIPTEERREISKLIDKKGASPELVRTNPAESDGEESDDDDI